MTITDVLLAVNDVDDDDVGMLMPSAMVVAPLVVVVVLATSLVVLLLLAVVVAVLLPMSIEPSPMSIPAIGSTVATGTTLLDELLVSHSVLIVTVGHVAEPDTSVYGLVDDVSTHGSDAALFWSLPVTKITSNTTGTLVSASVGGVYSISRFGPFHDGSL